MLPLLLALASALPNVAVRIEDARDVRPDEVERLSATFAGLIRASDRNVEVWTENTQEAVLMLRLEGAPTKIRLLAEVAPSTPPKKLILDIPRDEKTWRDALAPLVLDFFPPQPAATKNVTPGPALVATPAQQVEETDGISLTPFVLFGGSLVLAGTGIALYAANGRVQDRLRDQELAPEEIAELKDASSDRSRVGHLAVGTAVAAAVGGVVWLVFSE